ncbi:MAG: ABC transporter ATP-binding protein [Candidatus Zipacnadales bacterium]
MEESGPAIEIQGLSKRYTALHRSVRSLKTIAIGRLLRRPLPTTEGGALSGVSLMVQPGEAVGVIGPNGSGKTTLLGIISGVLVPTEGQVRTRGRVCVLLEAAVGFHPDLTGRENIMLQGMLLGVRRAEIREREESIIAFAQAEQYIDHAVRTLSLGQRARLGFSVAAHLSPDVFLIDEVLAIVDEEFHHACYAKLHELRTHGCAVVFVSHVMDQVREICERTLLLDQGRIIADGPTDEVIERYECLIAQRKLHH